MILIVFQRFLRYTKRLSDDVFLEELVTRYLSKEILCLRYDEKKLEWEPKYRSPQKSFFRERVFNRESNYIYQNDKPSMDSDRKYFKAFERILWRENIFFVSLWRLEISSVAENAGERIVRNSLHTQVWSELLNCY